MPAPEHKRTVVEKAVDEFLRTLRERNSSPHTIKAYAGDLDNFSSYVGSREWRSIDHLTIRGFLSHLYVKKLEKASIARSLAAVRSLYRWLAQEGVVEQNPAALVSTPKLPKKLPRVPTIEEMNSVLDGEMPEIAAFPEREQLMFELLYGCGIRNSELVGINTDDIRLTARSDLDSRQRKEGTLCPVGGLREVALPDIYRAASNCLAGRKSQPGIPGEPARRTPDYPQRRTDCENRLPLPVASRQTSIRTRCVMPSEHICWRRAPTCARSRRCWATSGFPPRSDTRNSP